MVSTLEKKNSIFPTKTKIAVGQLLAYSLQMNFKGEIRCLRIVKRLNLIVYMETSQQMDKFVKIWWEEGGG